MTAQFISQILAQLLEEVRQILVNLVRFDPRFVQRIQDVLHKRLRVQRILGGRRGTSGRLRDRRNRRRRHTRGNYVRRRDRLLRLLA